MKRGRVISLVVAMARNKVIGHANALPWHLPADLAHFRKLTMGRPIVMGRRTAESIGHALPGRRNLVVTHHPETLSIPGMETVASLEEAIERCRDADEVMIIGGASLYTQALPLAQRLHVTEIEASITGDTRFPNYDREPWRLISSEHHEPDERNPYGYTFKTFERTGGDA